MILAVNDSSPRRSVPVNVRDRSPSPSVSNRQTRWSRWGFEQRSSALTASQGHGQVVCLGVVLPGLVVVAIATRYKGYRYPIEVIGHAVWLYHRFALSLRDVEELMLARGVAVT